jgi:hypothetical protein
MRPLKLRDLTGKVRPSPAQSVTTPILISDGPLLCRLQVWTEAEWAVLPEEDRPTTFTHAPGLGWVGAVPIDCMN